MTSKKDVVLTDDAPTVKKIRAITTLLNTGTIAFETVVPQVIITLLFGGATVFIAARGQPVPEWLIGIDGLIVGFYFGSDFEYRRIKGRITQNGN